MNYPEPEFIQGIIDHAANLGRIHDWYLGPLDIYPINRDPKAFGQMGWRIVGVFVNHDMSVHRITLEFDKDDVPAAEDVARKLLDPLPKRDVDVWNYDKTDW